MARRNTVARSAVSLWCFLGCAAQYDSCTNGTVADIGNGRCDAENNNPSCGFDGGDCCWCTCADGPVHSCSDSDFDCLYPDCGDPTATPDEMGCLDGYWGDAYCDPINNNVACGYDGGDCCVCSCEDHPDYPCGFGGFACEDPACFDPAVVAGFPDCTGDWLSIGDGFCDEENNNPACDYDGGDCCVCSCSGAACVLSVYDCLDPEAYEEFYDCQEPPPAALPCSAGVQRAWVVDDTAQAKALAAAVNCSGGVFEVEWRGSVVVDQPIYVVDGTVLTVTGADSTATMDGNGSTRLFTVVNAVLHVTNVSVSSGASMAGGAVAATGSSVTFNRTSFLRNSAAGNGGAVYVSGASNVSCAGGETFADNWAALDGGAMYATDRSEVSCGGLWLNNTAGDSGGALRVEQSSTMSWGNEATFANNTAGRNGGVFSVYNRSSVFWSGGLTSFGHNSAVYAGGVLIATRSDISWSGNTDFNGNTADTCGGIFAAFGSSVTWSGEGKTAFINQNSSSFGGALYVIDSNVSWSGETEFGGNVAATGGAIYMMNGSSVSWTGDTEFRSNEASADGGVVASPVFDSLYNPHDSALVIDGTTVFSNNTCGANGGALALLGACSVAIGTAADVGFVGNIADVAGGAVFLSGTGVGPVFTEVSFVSNSAQVGGAFSIFGSGNSMEDSTPAPTTFNRCLFVGNRATATGGAVESAAGQDAFISSTFRGNFAGTGGALRLGGTASMDNCSFEENVSDDGEGAAVSNIGFISGMADISFSGNAFDCQEGMFLNWTASDDPYAAVCDGCPTACDECSFAEPLLAPTCSAVLDHSTSSGGTVTVETLSIEPGYWRASPSSPSILACFHADACVGGVTGATGYCLEGYEGPYCAICSEGYTAKLGETCSKCSDSAGGVALAIALVVVALLVAVAVVSYVMSGESGGRARGVIARVAPFIPLQSAKIVIVAWQILTQFTSVANITYPDVYQRFLNLLEVFNFDLGWVLSAGCVFDVDFHDRLLIATICPIAGLLFLACTYAAAARINRGSTETLQHVWHKNVSMVLLLTFFVYASVSATLFKTFACEVLDDGKNYLRADYRIECDSPKHRAFQGYAGLMMLLYTVGIPALYSVLLFRDSDVLKRDQPDREGLARITSTSHLWKPYRPSAFYYEVIECARRILLAGVVVFIYPNTAAQIAVTLLMAVVFAMLSEGLSPYASRWDAWISRMGHAVVTVSMYVALLLKVDVSDERASSQRVFETLLVAAHACMLLVILLETALQGVSLWAAKREEGPSPIRFRPGKVLGLKRGVDFGAAEDNPFSADVYKAERQRGEGRVPLSSRKQSSSSSSSRRTKKVAPATAEGALFSRSVDATETPSIY